MQPLLSSRYRKSILHLTRAEKVIPLGSQTFSKSRTQYPVGISPLYIDRAKGPYVWDIDGNKYVDLVNALASITLGYGDKEIELSIRKQLKKGTIFSLPGTLEAEVAELIVEMVPSAEMVRFGKNGTDATSAAIRLARAYTGRDRIAVCGYHGWQDWYIGSTTRNKGVPESVSALTHQFIYNDIESLKKSLAEFPGQFAAVIMEPMNAQWPNPGFLEGIRKITKDSGIVLIFDETITGFRFSRGGAQELLGVTPDLSTFGKGMANGFPLSAVVGTREIMMEMEEIFFSGTFGGELLSLAASKVILERYKKEDICGYLAKKGSSFANRLNSIIDDNNLSKILSLSGHDSWKFLNWKPTSQYSVEKIRTFFMQEMFKEGVLILGTHNLSMSFSTKAENLAITAYMKALKELSSGIENQNLEQKMEVEPLIPLFKVR